eukprot:6236942-Alexandrium_andersonii.AAC.1
MARPAAQLDLPGLGYPLGSPSGVPAAGLPMGPVGPGPAARPSPPGHRCLVLRSAGPARLRRRPEYRRRRGRSSPGG